VVGRPVRILAALARLDVLAARIRIYETQQLPNLLQSLSDLNRRQIQDTDNLVQSIPVALRNITWDLKKLSTLLDRVDEIEAWRSQVNASLGSQAESLEARAEEIQALQSIPGRVSELSTSLLDLIHRVEFTRRELMFEMRYGATSVNTNAPGEAKVEKNIISTEKFAEAKATGNVKLNLGCGHITLPGYLNVDRRALPGVDIVAEANDVPVQEGEVDEVFSSHMLEHFPQEQLRRELLPYWREILRDGGKFRAVVPDAETMIREYADGHYPYENLREVMFGAQDYDGDFHFNMFTPDSMTRLLLEAGFKDVQILEAGRRNGACYEFDIMATK